MATLDVEPQTKARRSAIPAFRYAVVDLASAPTLRAVVLKLLPSVAEPLFARNSAAQVLEVGPWLIQLSDAPEVDRTIADLGPTVPWGYFLHSSIDILSLRQSLRKFNLAQVDGHPRPMLFRYWDPRVLRSFLNHTSPAQRARFLEWIDLVEWADGGIVEKPDAADSGR